MFLLCLQVLNKCFSQTINCNLKENNILSKIDSSKFFSLKKNYIEEAIIYPNSALLLLSIDSVCLKKMIKHIKNRKYGLELHLAFTKKFQPQNFLLSYKYHYNEKNEVDYTIYKLNGFYWTMEDDNSHRISKRQLRAIKNYWIKQFSMSK